MKLIGVRDEDVLRYINDYFYLNSIYDYSIFNNKINEKKYKKDNRIQIILNPMDTSDDIIYLCDKFKFSKNDVTSVLAGYKELIPNRKDLIYVYKNLSELDGKKYCEINSSTNMKYAKILLCLDVLESMDLIKYKSDNRLVIELGDKPKGKIELENIKLFKFYKEILEL